MNLKTLTWLCCSERGKMFRLGVAEVTANAYSDPKEDDPKLAVVDLKPKKRLPKAVTLAQIKSAPAFADFLLLKISRLSVMPVSDEQWQMLSGGKL